MSKDKLPSIWQMTKSFSKDLTKYISEGAPNVSPEAKWKTTTCPINKWKAQDNGKVKKGDNTNSSN